MFSKLRFTLLVFFSSALFVSCASQSYLRSPGHDEFKEGNYLKAATIFNERAAQGGVNELLFLLDEGTALFAAQEYEKAIDVFLKAEKLAYVKDYTSVTEETGVLLTSNNVRSYAGEDFEKVLINVYLALSFAALGNEESALVEARKINLLLFRMINEGKRKYQESPFARYLAAMLWESSGEFDSAYVDYKKTYDLNSSFPEIGKDLQAMARKNGFQDRLKQWQDKFPKQNPRSIGRKQGELVLLFEAGRSPRKVPRDGESSNLPRYQRRDSSRQGARLLMGGEKSDSFVTVLDIERLSIDYLEERIGRMLAAKIAGAAAKGAVGYGVGKATKDSDLGMLVFLALMVADQADLRSWLSLPKEFQMLRVPLDAGKHSFEVEILSVGNTVIETKKFTDIEIKTGKKKFLIFR